MFEENVEDAKSLRDALRKQHTQNVHFDFFFPGNISVTVACISKDALPSPIAPATEKGERPEGDEQASTVSEAEQ